MPESIVFDPWKSIAVELEKNRPSVGKHVIIIRGRKHKGKKGLVIKHKLNVYEKIFGFKAAQTTKLRDMTGREGYVCQIQSGPEVFWVNADYTEILPVLDSALGQG